MGKLGRAWVVVVVMMRWGVHLCTAQLSCQEIPQSDPTQQIGITTTLYCCYKIEAKLKHTLLVMH